MAFHPCHCKAPSYEERDGCNDTVFAICNDVCICVCAVPGATAVVSASGSAERKLLRGGGRVCVRPIHRLWQHWHHRWVPRAVCPRCVCVCVWDRLSYLFSFLLYLFVSWTFFCVCANCVFVSSPAVPVRLEPFCVWVCCMRVSFHLCLCLLPSCVNCVRGVCSSCVLVSLPAVFVCPEPSYVGCIIVCLPVCAESVSCVIEFFLCVCVCVCVCLSLYMRKKIEVCFLMCIVCMWVIFLCPYPMCLCVSERDKDLPCI